MYDVKTSSVSENELLLFNHHMMIILNMVKPQREHGKNDFNAKISCNYLKKNEQN